MSADGFVLSAPSLFSAPCKKVIATKIPILIQNILSLNIPRPKEAHRSLTRISFTTYSITAVTIHETSEVCLPSLFWPQRQRQIITFIVDFTNWPIGCLRSEWNQGDWIFRQISLPPHSFLAFPFSIDLVLKKPMFVIQVHFCNQWL